MRILSLTVLLLASNCFGNKNNGPAPDTPVSQPDQGPSPKDDDNGSNTPAPAAAPKGKSTRPNPTPEEGAILKKRREQLEQSEVAETTKH